MKLKYYIYILPMLASCTAQPLYENDVIKLNGVISSSYATKSFVTAEPYKDTIPSTEKPFSADIWFSTTSGLYQNTGGLNSHKTITYYGPAVTNPSPDSLGYFIHYPTDGSNVYCVGLYPQGEWRTTDGVKASATIDGKMDLMFAAEKCGNKNDPLSASPQEYKHKLCWVKIGIRSDDMGAGETWGDVNKITISSADTATVDLGSGVVTYSGNTEIVPFEGSYSILVGYKEVGSVLISPALADDDGVRYFNVSFECKNHTRQNVKVPLYDYETGKQYTEDTAGKLFVLTLYFMPLDHFKFTATLSSWEDEGRVLELE